MCVNSRGSRRECRRDPVGGRDGLLTAGARGIALRHTRRRVCALPASPRISATARGTGRWRGGRAPVRPPLRRRGDRLVPTPDDPPPGRPRCGRRRPAPRPDRRRPRRPRRPAPASDPGATPGPGAGIRRSRGPGDSAGDALLRPGAESRPETLLRLLLGRAGLPEPEVNVDIRDDSGRFLGRADLVYPPWRTIVEYDGDQHRTSAAVRPGHHPHRGLRAGAVGGGTGPKPGPLHRAGGHGPPRRAGPQVVRPAPLRVSPSPTEWSRIDPPGQKKIDT
jgi:hypothetical protein